MEDCVDSLEQFSKDPFWLQTLPGGTESTGKVESICENKAKLKTSGLFNGWTAQPSEYAVEVMNKDDIAAAADISLRLVVKGTG